MKPIAGCRLRDRVQRRLGVAQQQLLQRGVRLYLLAQRARLEPEGAARELPTAVCNGISSPRMAETLYIPSRPIMPISTEAPSAIVVTTEINPATGK
jgi:hypothetical protein